MLIGIISSILIPGYWQFSTLCPRQDKCQCVANRFC
jgi:hypothetical protein